MALAACDELLLVEGAMGLFDGAPPDARGATADLARILGLPVVLIVDAARMAQSIAPLVAGFAAQDRDVELGAVILNRVGSPRHEKMLRAALAPLPIPVIGAIPRAQGLTHPSRHLGLVQAGERADLETFLDGAAELIAGAVDLDAITELAERLPAPPPMPRIPPPAQRIAMANDAAFAFSYPHLLEDWRAQGAEILPFSPLADEPVPQTDLVYLPGGYPELHAGRLAAAETFLSSLRAAAQTAMIHGECGGYMVLGDGWSMPMARATPWPGCCGWKPALPTGACIWDIAICGQRPLCRGVGRGVGLGRARIPLCHDPAGRGRSAVCRPRCRGHGPAADGAARGDGQRLFRAPDRPGRSGTFL